MVRRNKVIMTYGLWLADLLCIIFSYMIANYIRYGNFSDMADRSVHIMVCVCFLLFFTVYTFFIDNSRNFLTRGYLAEAVEVIKYNAAMVLVVGFFLFMIKKSDLFSRLVMGYFIVINIVLVYVVHLILKKVFYTMFSSERTVIKIMVAAERELLEETVKRLKDVLGVDYQITALACVDDRGNLEEIDGIPVVAGGEDLLEVAKQLPLDEVFINAYHLHREEKGKLIRGFGEMGVSCHYNLGVYQDAKNPGTVESFGGYTVISYDSFHSSYKRQLIKRFMDIAGGLVGSLIAIIMFPFLAAAIKLDSPGPVLFSQTRIGRNGRRFKIFKFRSMYVDAEERKKELEAQNEVKGLMFKMENDPRVTKVGKFLRKTSLDEFPQFFNVLVGDMSLVGTRPPTEDEFEKYNLYYRRRISMTPGLTGMWQVSGRSDIDDFEEVVRLDLQYIDNWSLTLDIKILIQTVGVVLFGKGAK